MKLPKFPTTMQGRIKLGLGVVVAIVALWITAALIYRVIFLPREAKRQQAEAITQQETAEAAVGAATDAITVTTEVRREVIRVDEVTRRNDRAIKQAAGAQTRAPGVARALNDGLCQYRAYQREPDCAALQGPGRELGAAGTDAGGAAPAE